MLSNISDLTETLGVVPLLHLTPKQDLAPLISFSRLDPGGIDHNSFVTDASLAAAHSVKKALEDGDPDASETIDSFVSQFISFQCPDEHNLKFRKPVISSNSDRTVALDHLDPLFRKIYESENSVDNLSLVNFETDLDVSAVLNDHLDLLQSYADFDHLAAARHVAYYRRKFDELISQNLAKRQRGPYLNFEQPNFTRKKAHIDTGMGDGVIASVYMVVDSICSIGTESSNGLPSIQNAKLSSLDALNLFSLLSRLASSSKLSKVDAAYLRAIASMSVNTINTYQEEAHNLDSPLFNLLLVTSKLLLLIINVNANDRRLHLDSYIEASVQMFTKFVHCLISQNRSLLSSTSSTLIQHISECTQSIIDYLRGNKADELILTKIEYISIEAIFADVNGESFDDLKNVLIQLLIQTFKYYPSQRQFIVNEMLNNFKSLSLRKASSYRMRLAQGVNVLFFSVFLMRLVQSFDAKSLSKDILSFEKLEKSKNPHSATNIKRQSLLRGAVAILDESRELASQISNFFADSLIKADNSYKSLFQTFLDDIITLLSALDWPGADLIAQSLMVTFSHNLDTNKFQGLMEPYALEVVGKIGIEILKIKHRCTLRLSISAQPSILDVDELSLRLNSVLTQVQNGNVQVFRFTILKILRVYETILSKMSSGVQEHVFAINPENNLSTMTPEAAVKIHSRIDDLFILLNKDTQFVKSTSVKSSGENSHLALLLYGLEPLFDNFIVLLVSYLESSKAKPMAKAIKLLSPMIDLDPNILLALRISKSISKTIAGNSPLVKDAIIDILGKYISTTPDLVMRYYKDISERSADDSISVRRRVIKLMKDMYVLQNDENMRTFIIKKLLRRVNDEEDTISELAKAYLKEMLFENELHSSPKDTCKIMIEIVNSPGMISKALAEYLTIVISNKEVNDSLKGMVNCVFGIIFETVETDPTYAGKALALVTLLAECDSKLISFEDLIFLNPYLVAEQSQYAEVCWYSLRVLRSFLQDSRNLRKDYIFKTRESLLARLTKFDVRELHEVVPIIETLSRKIGDSHKWVNALIRTMLLLQGMSGRKQMTNFDLAKCRKLIHLLGCFGSYCSFEGSREAILDSKIGLKTNETIVSLISKYLLAFCKTKYEHSVRKVAFRNLLCVGAHHPKLLMSESILQMIDDELSNGPHDIKLSIVEGLSKFLAKEDDDASKRDGLKLKSSQNLKLDLEVFHGKSISSLNDGVCASIIQRYVDKILNLCLMDHSAFAPVLFLQLVVKLGFANPKMCISTIIALEASSNKSIKKIATCLHMEIFERHESLADRNYTEAIRLAVDYSKRVNGRSFLRELLFLRTVYRVINKQYLSKKKFALSLAKIFQLSVNLTKLEECLQQRDVIVFVALNILVLPFSSLEEVCLLIFHLDRTITREGFDLAEKINKIMGSNSGSGMSMENLQLLFVNSQSVLGLVYLRRLLAVSYSISPSVIEEFRPSRGDLELRQPPRAINLIDFPLEELEMSNNLARPGSFGKVFTKLVLTVNSFST